VQVLSEVANVKAPPEVAVAVNVKSLLPMNLDIGVETVTVCDRPGMILPIDNAELSPTEFLATTETA
jgi:hypothetical protein